ncbi:hypothetical protein PHYC_02864 [Phycisphaerales bacterium]|nr:hypothetical protein PHYC_02864 [Phycisphaerales bacterium]
MTPKVESPRIEGAAPHARAAALAGWLAERGVKRVRLEWSGGVRELAARTTDLPGEMLKAMPCRLAAPEVGLVFEITDAAVSAKALAP